MSMCGIMKYFHKAQDLSVFTQSKIYVTIEDLLNRIQIHKMILLHINIKLTNEEIELINNFPYYNVPIRELPTLMHNIIQNAFSNCEVYTIPVKNRYTNTIIYIPDDENSIKYLDEKNVFFVILYLKI